MLQEKSNSIRELHDTVRNGQRSRRMMGRNQPILPKFGNFLSYSRKYKLFEKQFSCQPICPFFNEIVQLKLI